MSLKTLFCTVLAIALLGLFLASLNAQEGTDEEDLEGSNGAREEMIRRQQEEREESPYDQYGCPKEAPFTCTTNAFTLQMDCSCGSVGIGYGKR